MTAKPHPSFTDTAAGLIDPVAARELWKEE